MNKKNGTPQKTPDILVRDYVSSLNKISLINENLIELSHQMMIQSRSLLQAGIPLDTMFVQQIAKLATVFQVMAVEGIRSQNDISESIRVINSLQGRLIKLVDVPKKKGIILP